MQPASLATPADRTPDLGAARRDYQTFRRLLIALLVVASAGPLSLNLVDPDLWGHVRYAQDWIADGALPRESTHTYTAVGYRWVNHENLAELLLATGFPTLGVQGMLAAKVAFGMGLLLLMSLSARRQGVRPIAAWACFLLVAHNLEAFFPFRPQLLSFLWFAVSIYLLERAFLGWGNRRSDHAHTRRHCDRPPIDWRWLAGLPPVFALWANSHGGVLFGGAVLTLYLGGRAIEVFFRRGTAVWRTAAGLVGVLLASGAATLLNPYGIGLHRWMVGALSIPRPEITEWAAPSVDNPVFGPFVLLVAVAAAAFALTDRRRDWLKIAVLAVVLWQACTHLRHIAFFALLCGFWVPPHLQSIASRVRAKAAENLRTASLSRKTRLGIGAALAGAIALQAVFLGERIKDLPVDRSYYPVDALQWMSEQGAKGRLIVCFNWAQYAIAALAPDVRVSFDGRFRTCYPQEVIDRHFDFLMADLGPRYRSPASGPIDGLATLRVDRPDYVLVDRQYPRPVRVMAEAAAAPDSPWTLVYEDAVASVYARREVVDDPALATFIPTDRRYISDHLSLTTVTWPALPRRRGAAVAPAEPREVATRADDSPRPRPYPEG